MRFLFLALAITVMVLVVNNWRLQHRNH